MASVKYNASIRYVKDFLLQDSAPKKHASSSNNFICIACDTTLFEQVERDREAGLRILCLDFSARSLITTVNVC
jgi:hypothetical protein